MTDDGLLMTFPHHHHEDADDDEHHREEDEPNEEAEQQLWVLQPAGVVLQLLRQLGTIWRTLVL